MGTIAENFHTWDGVRRSNHPHFSFAAWGKHAEFVTGDHKYAFGMDKDSPLGKIYDLDGHVLLLGVGRNNNTSLHLAEHISPHTVWHMQGAPVLVNGKREYVTFEEVEMPDHLFSLEGIGADFEKETDFVTIGQVGSAESRLFRQRPCVDFALQWIEKQVNS
jgi:aminoglycoside 3-N-acetyltransferase